MTREIPLTQGVTALVDDDDYDRLIAFKWFLRMPQAYAVRNVKKRACYMHRVVMNAPAGYCVDHINGIGNDNRKCNLRLCTARQNSWNARPYRNTVSIYKGVYWAKDRCRWKARITVARKVIYLGTFINELDAALAYDTAARRMFGTFARTNFEVQP